MFPFLLYTGSTLDDDGDVVDVVPEGMEEDESSDSDLEVKI